MQPRNWRGLVVEARMPSIRDTAIAASLTVAMHDQPGPGRLLAIGAGLLALDSVRVRRATKLGSGEEA